MKTVFNEIFEQVSTHTPHFGTHNASVGKVGGEEVVHWKKIIQCRWNV